MEMAETTDVGVEHDERPMLRPVRPDLIRLDGGTQLRVATRPETVDEYAEVFRSGKGFPPPDVYYDLDHYWPADGHQRIEAAVKAGKGSILCAVHAGTVRDAILHAVGANQSHGDRRTRADARNAVATMLRDEEWSKWSDREIGRRCGVDGKTVASVRHALTAESPQSSLRTGADGRTIDTSKIGSRPSPDGDGQHARPEAPSSPDFEGPPEVQADDPPGIAEQRRKGFVPATAEVQVEEPEQGEGSETGGGDPADLPPAAEATDEEWLATLPARAHLPEPIRTRFDTAALLYRQIAPIRLEYVERCRPLTDRAERETEGDVGPWMSRHSCYLSMNDPSRWQACKGCSGTGRLDLFRPCIACHGEGYHL